MRYGWPMSQGAIFGWAVCAACVLLAAAGCERDAASAHRPGKVIGMKVPAEQAEPIPPPQPAQHAEPSDETPTAPSGECPTAERCDAEASAHERRGQPDRAAALYARACELGLGSSCHRLGELHRDGRGVPASDDRARELFTRGCHQGSNAACDALGH